MTRKQQIRGRCPCAQLIIGFHPSHQVNDEGAGPILPVIAKHMRAVGTQNGCALSRVDGHRLQAHRVARGKQALDAGNNLLIAFT